MKRTISLLLCFVMALLLLASCGQDGGAGSSAPATSGNGGNTSSGKPEEITILYPGEESDRMTSFLNGEFAERMLEDLNMKVNVIFVPWDQYWDKKGIMLGSQEPIDLYWDGLVDLGEFVNKKEAQPLDDLIEQYGQDMLKVLPMEHIQGGAIDGTIYGIPSAYASSSAMFQQVCLRQDLLTAVGMTEISTPEDLKEFATRAMEQFPNIKGAGDPILMPLTRYFSDQPAHNIAKGFLAFFNEETKEVFSYYESEAFQKVAKFNREMTLAGLYPDEMTTNYNERDSRVQSGNYLWVEGSLGKETEIIDAVRANAPDAVMKNYLLAPEKPKYITAAGGEVICIPYSAPNPSGAMKWLNWLYSSQENYLFALYGVEGKDYEIVNGRINRLITDELFYEWMFRNKNYQMFPVETDAAYIEATKTWDDDAIRSPIFGFVYSDENLKEIELNLVEVEKQFEAIRSGFVDFDTEYPKAVEALKNAGIDEYIADLQRQVDEFLAA